MAAKSNNKYDVFEWIKQVIDSCETRVLTNARVHTKSTDKLIKNFHNVYNDSTLTMVLKLYQKK